MKSVPRSPLAALVLLALSVAATAGPERTTLSGHLLDAVTGAGIADATVRLGNRSARSGPGGEFELRLGRRDAPWIATSVESQGNLAYRTWARSGETTVREVYPFPDRDVLLPGIPGHGSDIVTAAQLRQQFDAVYRDDLQVGGRLTRWMVQPEIRIVDHVVLGRNVAGPDGHPAWEIYASERRTPARVLRRLRRAIRDAIGPLTHEFLNGDAVRRERVRPGDILASSQETLYPEGVLRVYVHDRRTGPGGGGAGRLRGQTIVAGALFMFDEVFLRPPDEYAPTLLNHELGHVLGMYHPPTWPNDWALGTPLCSVVSQMECERGHVLRGPTPIDLVTARLAYSRLPGNDRDDVDPQPEPSARARERLVVFDDAPPWSRQR